MRKQAKEGMASKIASQHLLAKMQPKKTQPKKKTKKKRGRLVRTKKAIKDLEENEITSPRRGGRYKGTSVGRDENGYFVTTHRARSKSYPSPKEIPESRVVWVRSTG